MTMLEGIDLIIIETRAFRLKGTNKHYMENLIISRYE